MFRFIFNLFNVFCGGPPPESVAEVMEKHGDRILRVAYSYLHNMEDAEDILQDTLIKYMQSSPEFNGPEHEKAWLITVASNLSKNKIKYNKSGKLTNLLKSSWEERSRILPLYGKRLSSFRSSTGRQSISFTRKVTQRER